MAIRARAGEAVSGASPAERIISCVERIPAGRVMSYGDVAEYAGTRAVRMVGQVLRSAGSGPDRDCDGDLPWHRVVRADGSCVEFLRAEQLALLLAEGVPLRGERVDLALARWDGR